MPDNLVVGTDYALFQKGNYSYLWSYDNKVYLKIMPDECEAVWAYALVTPEAERTFDDLYAFLSRSFPKVKLDVREDTPELEHTHSHKVYINHINFEILKVRLPQIIPYICFLKGLVGRYTEGITFCYNETFFETEDRTLNKKVKYKDVTFFKGEARQKPPVYLNKVLDVQGGPPMFTTVTDPGHYLPKILARELSQSKPHYMVRSQVSEQADKIEFSLIATIEL